MMKIFIALLALVVFSLAASACAGRVPEVPVKVITQVVDKEIIQTHIVEKVIEITSTPMPPVIPPDENFPGVIGWESDKDAVIAYYNGSFYVRDGKEKRYSFRIFNGPATLKWYNSEGYLPALVTEFERDDVTVKIINFADKVTLNRRDFVIVYSRVSIYNHGKEAVSLSPAPTEGLVELTRTGLAIQPGQTAVHDYAVAADRFGKKYRWPSDEDLAAAGSWDEHYIHMKEYWNSRLGEIVNITQLPDSRLIDAYKAGFIYTHIVRDGDDIHVGENGYDMVFDHDSLGILTTLFTLGDFTNAKPLLEALQAQTQYDDATYKNSWVWALYLLKTGDEDFVKKHFNEIKQNTHKIEKDLTGPGGIVKMTNDIDANGYWTIDNASALFGLATYQYIANRLGNTREAEWASSLYDRLLIAVNNTLQQTMDSSGINYLPCALTQPNDDNRCRDPKDANWASMLLFGRWYWEGYLWGADQHGPMLDSIDATYTYGFNRLKGILPEHTYGGYPGYSTGYNAGYGRSGLRGTQYRSEAIKDYIFMLDNTQSSPFGWWENIGEPGQAPWEGNHPGTGGGSCPHMWGQSFATAGLLDSLIVEKADGTLLVGRGVPDEWIEEGQVIELSNYPVSNNRRVGIKIEGLTGNRVSLSLSGDMPGGKVVFNLPIFIKNIRTASAGKVDSEAGTVTIDPGTTSITVEITNPGGLP